MLNACLMSVKYATEKDNNVKERHHFVISGDNFLINRTCKKNRLFKKNNLLGIFIPHHNYTQTFLPKAGL